MGRSLRKYDIHPDFLPVSAFKPPVTPAILPFANAFLSLPAIRSDEEVFIRRMRVPGLDKNPIPVRIFEPANAGKNAPCLLYLHGGGFAVKAAGYHYRLAREYALACGCRVVFPDYRLAPDHPFPAALRDSWAVYKWLLRHAKALGTDPARIAVGGDSAGGALAAAVCLLARDTHAPAPCFQLLIYPVCDRRMMTYSMAAYPDTPMWNGEKNRAMWKMYLPDPQAWPVEYASPMEASDLSGLPPCYLETAYFDCLRDEGAAYAAALAKAGVPTEYNPTLRTVHGYDFVENSAVTRDAVRRRIGALRRGFGPAD